MTESSEVNCAVDPAGSISAISLGFNLHTAVRACAEWGGGGSIKQEPDSCPDLSTHASIPYPHCLQQAFGTKRGKGHFWHSTPNTGLGTSPNPNPNPLRPRATV